VDGSIETGPLAPAHGHPVRFGSTRTGAYPAYRYALLLEGGYFTPDYCTDASDYRVGGDAKRPAEPGSEVTPANFSYAMLALNEPARRKHWKETVASSMVLISDRNVGTAESPRSILTFESDSWHGRVVTNDGGVHWSEQPVVESDHLFKSGDGLRGAEKGDAAMVFATDRDLEHQQ
jgi:hypothetical protein